ncbi:MAG: type II toxin-antitoxin system BrnA family antitoxin [Acidithiobacillus ferrooxidans]|uniref:Protein containing DUF497 n=1 Tax=mine drainage metagenome TaxID=410659 RepID=E6QDB4_9ZZZZ
MDDFEFDEAKSQANLDKHGIDFVADQVLWKDPFLLEIRAKSEDEPRFLLIGKIGDKHWLAVVTYRDARIRLISVRRSPARRRLSSMKAKEFDKKFEEGQEDIDDDLDLSSARRVNQEQKRINVDFPAWVVASLDREAARIGVTRQSIIKVWLVERLQAESANKPLNGDAASGAH